MPSARSAAALCVLALLAMPPAAFSQLTTAGLPVAPGAPALEQVNSTRELLGDVTSLPPPFVPAPTQTSPLPQSELRFDATFLPAGRDSLAITDLEGSAKFFVPLGELAPLKVVPGGAIRLWEGPANGANFDDLPGNVYDLYVDLGWRPRPAEWLFLDFQLTPGIYTDFRRLGHSAFRPRGHGIAIVALSEQFQLLAGVTYVNRLRTTLLPVGGFRWAPDEDTEFRLVFPAPRISRRLFSTGQTKWWGYLAGEFGGGAWAIERQLGGGAAFADVVDYSDVRVMTGLEAVGVGGWKGRVEAGYAFGRQYLFGTGFPGTVSLPAAVVLRVGLSY